MSWVKLMIRRPDRVGTLDWPRPLPHTALLLQPVERQLRPRG